MPRRNDSSGFSLVEVMAVTAVFAIAMTAVLTAMANSQRNYTDYTVGSELRDRARAILDRMEGELREAGTCGPNFYLVDGTGTLTFNQCNGFDGYNITWDSPVTFTRTPQGRVTRTQNGVTRTLADSVTNLSFSYANGYVVVQMTMAQAGSTGRTITQAVDSKIFLRNE